MHLINEEASLKGCYYELDGKKAIGTDGVTKVQFSFDLRFQRVYKEYFKEKW